MTILKTVATARFADAGLLYVMIHQIARHTGRQPASGDAQEHLAFVRFNDELGAGVFQVFVEP